ncbi:MAG: UbiH/UbiF/VisC/COQ6 family ubiquinone biosynthesis hydroxylase [Pseudomonadota bacterium]
MAKGTYDVAVLGGGLVGCAMAITLAREEFAVALLDPAPLAMRADPDFDGRAYAVAPGSRNLLRALGIWEAIAPKAQPVHRITVTDRTPGPVAPALLHFDPADTGAASLGEIVEDRFLRRALLDGLGDIEHLAGTAATGITQDPGFARIATANGEVSARLVVCCDGRRSALALASGIQYLAWSYQQTGLVSAISHELPHEGEAHQSFFAGGPFAVLPLTGNRSSLVWSEQDARAAEIAAMDDAAYMAEIRLRLDDRLGVAELAGRRWAYPLGLSLAQNYAAPRVVVAGDAAHGVHPIAGQGMNLGLRDVAALAEVLTDAARRGEDIGSMIVLDRYQQWRRPDATVMALGMDGLNRLFSTGAAPVQAIRNLGMGAVANSGAAKSIFAGLASGSDSNAPRLLRG